MIPRQARKQPLSGRRLLKHPERGGLKDLLQPGHRVLVVNGAGQNGMWEDVAGRLGDIASVRTFRSNIATYAANSALARQAWTEDKSLDAWLI